MQQMKRNKKIYKTSTEISTNKRINKKRNENVLKKDHFKMFQTFWNASL